MDSKGFRSEYQRIRHLETFLNYPPKGPYPSVWKLQAFLSDENTTTVPRPVLLDYWFVNCDGYFEIMELKRVYREVLGKADPLALHDSCIKGTLFEFTSSCLKVDPKLKEKMRNIYPLPDV